MNIFAEHLADISNTSFNFNLFDASDFRVVPNPLEWHAHVIIECFIVSNFFISEANVMGKEKKMRIIYFNTDKCTKAII